MMIGLLALSVSKRVRPTGAQKDPIQGTEINPRSLIRTQKTTIVRNEPSRRIAQLLEQRLGLLQVGGVKALGEPVVDFGENLRVPRHSCLASRAGARGWSSRAAPMTSRAACARLR